MKIEDYLCAKHVIQMVVRVINLSEERDLSNYLMKFGEFDCQKLKVQEFN